MLDKKILLYNFSYYEIPTQMTFTQKFSIHIYNQYEN